MKTMIQCDSCGNRFTFGNTNGLPNGVTLVGGDGKQTTLFQKCVIELGQMDEDQKRAFFKKLKKSND